MFLSWLNHLQNLGAACGGAARSESPAGELRRLAPAASPGPRPVLCGCPGADREEDKKERAGPSGPARCRTVPFCADYTRTPSLRAEDHSARLWEGYRVGNAVPKTPSPKGRGGRISSSSRGAAARCFAPGALREKRAVTGIGAEVRSLTFFLINDVFQ